MVQEDPVSLTVIMISDGRPKRVVRTGESKEKNEKPGSRAKQS
jgi:galactose-1-phosphate uridylyltransferase